VSKILVTGAAGFVGMHLAQKLLGLGHEVVGIDNLNDYYDPALKMARLDNLTGLKGFSFVRLDLADRAATAALFAGGRFERVAHLAAQAGVRYSLKNPSAYASSNLEGFLNVLEGCRHTGAHHLVFASSSSVYGMNRAPLFSERMNVDHPISLYAATKKANELMAHAYSHLYGLPTTGLRFFTVYGPWGRPDMAYFLFTRKILAGEPIEVFNEGRMQRDFTYIDDVVEGVVRCLDSSPAPDTGFDPANPDPSCSSAPYRIYNIGNNRPEELMKLISLIEGEVGKKAVMLMRPMQPGDVLATAADISGLSDATGFRPTTSLEEGIARFVEWYRGFYG